MNKVTFQFLISFLFFIGCISSSSASAGNRVGIHPLLSDDFSANLGWYYAKTNSTVKANGDVDLGDDIDLENDLNFSENSSIFIGGAKWRFTQRFHTSFEYLSISRDASAILNKNISWDGKDYAAGANISSDVNLDVSRIFVGYSFMQSKNFELGAGLGVHLMNLKVGLAGEATIDGLPIGNSISGKEGLAPLPNIGFYTAYAFSPKLLVSGRADWFSAKVGDYKGGLTSLVADVQYQAFKNVGFGAGYHYLTVDIEVNKDSWHGEADFTYNGPKLFMTVNF